MDQQYVKKQQQHKPHHFYTWDVNKVAAMINLLLLQQIDGNDERFLSFQQLMCTEVKNVFIYL